MTSAEINSIIDQISVYAADEGLSLSRVNDVRQNDDLMTIVASGWLSG